MIPAAVQEREESIRRMELRIARITGWTPCRSAGLSYPQPPASAGFAGDLWVDGEGIVRLNFEVCGPAFVLRAGAEAAVREADRLAALGVVHGERVP